MEQHITLTTCDEQALQAPWSVVCQSATLRNAVEALGAPSALQTCIVPLSHVACADAATLGFALEFASDAQNASDFVKRVYVHDIHQQDCRQLLRLMQLADYLEMPHLLDTCARAVAEHINNQPRSVVVRELGIAPLAQTTRKARKAHGTMKTQTKRQRDE